MPGDVKYKIPLLDKFNYGSWKFRMEVLLEELDLLDLVNTPYTELQAKCLYKDGKKIRGTAKQQNQLSLLEEKNRKCKSQIVQSLPDSHLRYIKDKSTACEMWCALKSVFEGKGIAEQLLIRKTLLTMKHQPSLETLLSHFQNFDKQIRNLKLAGGTMEDLDEVCHLLITLPSEYDNVVTEIGTLPSAELRLCCVKDLLLNEEEKVTGINTKNKPKQSLTGVESKSGCIKWILDSGSSAHITNDPSALVNVQRLPSPIIMRSAKAGGLMRAEKCGEFRFRKFVNKRPIPVTIKDVLITPEIGYSVWSVSQLESSGYKTVFADGKGIISKDDVVLAEAVRTKKIYYIEFIRDRQVPVWHKRCLLTELPGANEVDIEMKRKQTNLPHHKEESRAKRPLEIIHNYIWQMPFESYDGKKYAIAFIDDFTHFISLYLMSTKSEAFLYFKIFEANATERFGLHVSRFRCNNRKEYISDEIWNHFHRRGIQFEFLTRGQIDLGSQMFEYFMEQSSYMLSASQMNNSLWSEALRAAVYLTNRSTTFATTCAVPAELWYGIKPVDIRKLKGFGCVAHACIPEYLQNGELDTLPTKCYIVGYHQDHYRLWCPKSNRVTLASDNALHSHICIAEIICYEFPCQEGGIELVFPRNK